ncbi:hypothetical protein EVG20_g10749 [Dentipellis fragilis]|uniref:Uncharacterized protein n=1 Tax=Dentipellis fragilis TaxID=205917 RepID=A0A4Y9XQE8_9AGAM|nr:hypothetical protein EVG20_g10749 [Dentipellis fragilis]
MAENLNILHARLVPFVFEIRVPGDIVLTIRFATSIIQMASIRVAKAVLSTNICSVFMGSVSSQMSNTVAHFAFNARAPATPFRNYIMHRTRSSERPCPSPSTQMPTAGHDDASRGPASGPRISAH